MMIRLAIIIVLVLGAAAGEQGLARPEREVPRQSLSNFPKEFGDWVMVAEQSIDDRSMVK